MVFEDILCWCNWQHWVVVRDEPVNYLKALMDIDLWHEFLAGCGFAPLRWRKAKIQATK